MRRLQNVARHNLKHLQRPESCCLSRIYISVVTAWKNCQTCNIRLWIAAPMTVSKLPERHMLSITACHPTCTDAIYVYTKLTRRLRARRADCLLAWATSVLAGYD